MAYIASAPVRFDRDYKIGEIIPPEVIDPNMADNLIRMGKIISADVPSAPKPEPDAPEDGEPQAEGQGSAPDAVPAGGEKSAGLPPGNLDAEQLAAWKNADLEKLAADLGVDISKAKNKAERAQLIAAAGMLSRAAHEETREDFELPSE